MKLGGRQGLKIRGVFQTQEEAEMKCKKLREIDPNHDIYVGPVGMWIPWDPDAYKTGRVEFMEDELNQLHHEKLKNETKAKEEFDRRVLETKRKQKCVFTLSSSFWKMFLQLHLSLTNSLKRNTNSFVCEATWGRYGGQRGGNHWQVFLIS